MKIKSIKLIIDIKRKENGFVILSDFLFSKTYALYNYRILPTHGSIFNGMYILGDLPNHYSYSLHI